MDTKRKTSNSSYYWFTSENLCIWGIIHRWKNSYSDDMIPLIVIHSFLDYLKKLQNKFHKVILFLDRAPQHYRSIIVRKHSEENKDILRVEWFPKGSPEFNAVEECWKQGKDDLLVSRYYPKFHNLKKSITKYYRTKRFSLDITKYLLRNVT